MEFLLGVLDLAALVVSTRRWVFWLLLALIAIGALAAAANFMEPGRPSF